MSDVVIRPFRREDRDQLTELVNGHIQAVMPGMSVSVNRVLSQLEREPGEFIVDRWVAERVTLVAEQRGRVVAGAHLLRYRDDDRTSASYRGVGDIRWLVCAVDAPFWPGASRAGAELVDAAVRVLSRAGVNRVSADGGLPAPGVYGIPDAWPHIRELLLGAGFTEGLRVEWIWLAEVGDLRRVEVPEPAMTLRRTLGVSGTRFTAMLDGDDVGYVEVDLRNTDLGRMSDPGGWADVGNLWVAEPFRRRGIASWAARRGS